jgi:AraC-like DNA-binding protein
MLSGAARWIVEPERPLTLTGGTFSLLQPGVSHQGLFQQLDPCELAWLDFHPGAAMPESRWLGRRALAEMDASFRNAGNAVFKTNLRLKSAVAVFADTARGLASSELGDEDRVWLQTSLVQIVLAVREIVAHHAPADRPELNLVERCDRFIEARLAGPIRIGELARQVNMSPGAFFARFRRETGMTPADYVRRARIRHAENLMVRTDMSLTDIAMACGFSSSQYFATSFREYAGIQPSRFREQSRLDGGSSLLTMAKDGVKNGAVT